MNIDHQKSDRINILLVDDNPDNLRLLSNVLTEHGYHTRRVISGHMALQAVKNNNFDLIFLDINIPDIDGYEICQQLKINPKTTNIPIIFISALNETCDRVKAFKAGGTDYISKPFQFEEVIARVENQVKILSLQKQLLKVNINLKQKIQQKNQKIEIVTQKNKYFQEQLLSKSLKDSVTNLYNRIYLMGKLRKAIKSIETEPNYCFTLIIFECYCSQMVNEALHFSIEDAIDISIAKRLSDYVSNSELVARLSDREFAIMFDGVGDLKRANQIAEKIKDTLTSPLKINDRQYELKTYYGIGLGTKNNSKLEDIIRYTRTLIRRAKQKSKLGNNFNNNKLLETANKANISPMTIQFYKAVQGKKINFLYQPIIHLNTGQIKELEVFLAWSELQNKIISVQEISNAIEQKSVLNLLILKWIFQTAKHDLKKWQDTIIWNENLTHLEDKIVIRLKLVEQQLMLPNLIEHLKNITNNLELDCEYIVLEIPEIFVIENAKKAEQIIKNLKQIGFKISLNNISIQYLSINNQYDFAIDNLKISSTSIDKTNCSSHQKVIIDKTIDLIHELNIHTTATDIKTDRQLQFCQKIGCQFGTGDFFSQPINSQAVESMIISNHFFNKKTSYV